MKKLRFPSLGISLVVVAALIASSCSRAGSGAAIAAPPADLATVAVAKVLTEDLSRDLVLTAEFKPFQEVDVMAKVAGYIKNIKVDVGDRVKQGQLLAILEVPEMADDKARAKAAVDRSQAEVARERDELTRARSAHEISHISYQRLFAVAEQKPGLVAQQEIDDARGKDLVSEAQVSAAQSALAAASEQVAVNRAEQNKIQTLFEYTSVTAPFTGVVTRRYADTGSMIQAGTASQTQAMPVVRLSENSLLRLILPVPESAVPTVHIGQQVEVRVPTLNRSFPGRVARFNDKLSLATRTMDTEVDVPNPSLVLIPGMYAEVDLTLQQRNAVLTVPVTAVDMAGGEGGDEPRDRSRSGAAGQVIVVTPNNQLEIRRVTLGLETATRVEVRSGLRKGEMVVIGNRSSLQQGQQVRPKVTTLAAAAS
jgi:RND family efflux transporter MFP subunit